MDHRDHDHHEHKSDGSCCGSHKAEDKTASKAVEG